MRTPPRGKSENSRKCAAAWKRPARWWRHGGSASKKNNCDRRRRGGEMRKNGAEGRKKERSQAASGQIDTACPDCGATYKLSLDKAGKRVLCRKCRSAFTVSEDNRTQRGRDDDDDRPRRREEDDDDRPSRRYPLYLAVCFIFGLFAPLLIAFILVFKFLIK